MHLALSAARRPVLNLASAELRADPYPVYARLRASAPVARVALPIFGHAWLVTRYADVVALHKDPRFSSNARHGRGNAWMTGPWLPRFFRLIQQCMVLYDNPDHQRLRGLVQQAFTPPRIASVAASVAAAAHALLDDLQRQAAGGPVDLIAGFAMPLPLMVIGRMLGVPEQARRDFHQWTARFPEAASGGPQALALAPNGQRLLRLFEDLVRQRRAAPRDDLISALVAAEQAGDRLSEDEVLSMLFLLLLAGHETTANLLGNGTLALLQHPEQLQRLRADPALLPSAVEELLRYTGTVEHGSTRFALEDVELHGVPIRRGDQVLVMLSAANRDEAVFAHPDQLDLARHPNRHVALGLGLHYCLGAPLARLESQIAFRVLLERRPNLRLAVPPERLRWRRALSVRALEALPVYWGA
jgi:cytochrome P450